MTNPKVYKRHEGYFGFMIEYYRKGYWFFSLWAGNFEIQFNLWPKEK